MDMDLSFADKMRTTVYIKMDAHDQLLLPEGVCRQLGIVSYHPSVYMHRKGHKENNNKGPNDLGQSHSVTWATTQPRCNGLCEAGRRH